MAAEPEVLDELHRLRARVPQLTGALAASADGLVLAHDTPGVEPDGLAALTAAALGVAIRMAESTGHGDLRELLVRGVHGYVATYAAKRLRRADAARPGPRQRRPACTWRGAVPAPGSANSSTPPRRAASRSPTRPRPPRRPRRALRVHARRAAPPPRAPLLPLRPTTREHQRVEGAPHHDEHRDRPQRGTGVHRGRDRRRPRRLHQRHGAGHHRWQQELRPHGRGHAATPTSSAPSCARWNTWA